MNKKQKRKELINKYQEENKIFHDEYRRSEKVSTKSGFSEYEQKVYGKVEVKAKEEPVKEQMTVTDGVLSEVFYYMPPVTYSSAFTKQVIQNADGSITYSPFYKDEIKW